MGDSTSSNSGSSSFKFPRPQLYQGERDGFKCNAWLTSVRRFFVGANITEAQHTLHAVVFLTGSAALWWEGQALTDAGPFVSFEKAFREEFCPARFEDHVRSLLFCIRMESTVVDYIARLRRYMAVLCPPEISNDAHELLNSTAKTCFLNGCPDALRRMLQSLDIANGSKKTVHELCATAEQFDTIYHFSASSPPTAVASGVQQFVTAQSGARLDPMAMEIDNLRIQLNALRQQFRSSGPHPPFRTTPRLSDEERQRLYQRGACFRCRQDGHVSRDCPNRNGRGFNNISSNMGDFPGTLPGNASSGQV